MKRQRLGQHYLVDRLVIRRVVDAAGIRPSERVLEIGTGRGALTVELLGRGASYTGYEVDRQNYEATVEALGGADAKVVLGDAFDQRPEFDVLVSSLPYSESATFVRWLSGMDFERAVVVLQSDFVEKVMAQPGDRDYRGVSALAQVAFRLEVLGRIERKAFSPQPKVDSVIVSITPRMTVSEEEAGRIVRLFTLRRRQVSAALAELGIQEKVEHARRRVYTLRPEEVHELCGQGTSP